MLVASYLLGYDDEGAIGHVGLDKAFPDNLDGAQFELSEREGAGGNSVFDLMVIFPSAEIPKNLICLLDLPDVVVARLANGGELPIVDFSCGRLVRCSLDLALGRCA